jgi:hypothetical protein
LNRTGPHPLDDRAQDRVHAFQVEYCSSHEMLTQSQAVGEEAIRGIPFKRHQ